MEQAENEIKEINQQSLFQMAELKKRFRERKSESISRIESYFNETYNKFLNNSLSSSLLKVKEEVLQVKNKIMSEFVKDLTQLIKDKINKNYSNYINFLIKIFKNISHFIDKPPEIIIELNSRDYKYLSDDINIIQNLFKHKVKLKNLENKFIGGFRCIQLSENISYDYTIENLLNKNTSLIEIEISKILSESDMDIKKTEQDYERLIQEQKSAINKNK